MVVEEVVSLEFIEFNINIINENQTLIMAAAGVKAWGIPVFAFGNSPSPLSPCL